MMSQTTRPITLLVAMLSAAPIAAQAQRSTALTDREGPFVGASLGAAGVTLRSIGRVETGDPASSGVSAKLRLGYWFGKHWGVEASGVRLGRLSQGFDGGVWQAKGQSVMLSGLGRVALAPDWSMVGKLSLLRTRLRDDGSSGDKTGFEQLNGSRSSVVLGGVGLEYTLTDQAALVIEADGLGQGGKRAMPAYLGVGLRWAF